MSHATQTLEKFDFKGRKSTGLITQSRTLFFNIKQLIIFFFFQRRSCPQAFLFKLRCSRSKIKRRKRTGDNNLSPGLLCSTQRCCPSHNTWRKCHTNRGSRIRAEKDLVTALLPSQHWCLQKIKPGKRPRVPTLYCCCLGFNLYVWTMYIFHWFRWGAMNVFIWAETVTGLLMFTVTG